jgi:hypothetical protein
MTINTEVCSIRYVLDAAHMVYTYNFLIPSTPSGEGDVQVWLIDTDGNTTLVPSTEYTLSGLDNPSGGTITYPYGFDPESEHKVLVIMRDVPYEQLTAVRNQAFFPHTLEEVADYLTMQTQQLEEKAGRAIEAPPGDRFGKFLKPAALRAFKFLQFDFAGDPIATDGTPVGPPPGMFWQEPSKAAAELDNIPMVVYSVVLAGYYTPGDGGGARYTRVASQPAHPGWFQSADGAYWEIAEPSGVNVNMFGAKGDAILLTDAITASGSNLVTSVSANFTAADVGKMIEIPLAGAGGKGITTTISSVVDAHSIRIVGNAGVTLNPAPRLWYGTNDVLNILRATTYINYFKGGRLELLPDHNYQLDLRPYASGDALAIMWNMFNFTFDFNGGKIVAMRDFSIGGTPNGLFLLHISFNQNFQLLNGNWEFYSDVTASSFSYGVVPVAGHSNFNTGFQSFQIGGRMGLWLAQDPPLANQAPSNILDVDLVTINTAYALTLYETTDVIGRVWASGSERSLFAVNIKNVNLEIRSNNAKAEDIIIIAEASEQRPSNSMENVLINYSNPGRTSAIAGGACVQHVMRTNGIAGGAVSSNVRVNMVVNMAGAIGEGVAFSLTRQLETAPGVYVYDTGPARGHFVQGLTITGVLQGLTTPRAVGQLAMDWPVGEHIDNLTIDMVANGSGGSLIIDGAALESSLNLSLFGPNIFLDFRNVPTAFVGLSRVVAANIRTAGGAGRPRLTQPMQMFVRPGDGADGSLGLFNSPGAAKQTLQGAINAALAYDLGGNFITINLADGTYAPATIIGRSPGSPGPGGLVITGNAGNPALTNITATGTNNALTARGGAQLSIQNLSFTVGTGARVQALDYGTVIYVGPGTPFANAAIGGTSPTQANGILT